MDKAKEGDEEGTLVLSDQQRARTVNVLVFSVFQAVLQHVLALQSEIKLFNNAVNGDQAALSRALSLATGTAGVAGLFMNQIGGKCSDALGRRRGFLLGPAIVMFCSASAVTFPRNISVLTLCRVLRAVFITFSGTVMTLASLGDLIKGKEMAAAMTKTQLGIGCAVILGPFIESLMLKLSKGDPRGPFKAMFALASMQLLFGARLVPETLTVAKRKPIADFQSFAQSINPFAFLKVYSGNNIVLKKLLTINTFQLCSDGKVTSDLLQIWGANVLKWEATMLRNFVSFWGATVFMSSAIVHPLLLKSLSVYNYSTLGNLSLWLGQTLHGLAPRGALMWAGVVCLIPGINGGNATAIRALTMKKAEAEGYGNGEFAAWATNLRTMVQSLDIVLIGSWYARCHQRKIYPGTTWWLAAFIAGGLPQLMMLTMKATDFEAPVTQQAARCSLGATRNSV